jgi:hypothetical protein
VSVRLPLAFLVGVAAAVLVACGGGSNKKLLPAVTADRLKNDLADLRQALDQHDCAAANTALVAFTGDLDRIPNTVDKRLRARLRVGAAKLADRVPQDCRQTTTTTETVPTTTTPTTDTTTIPPTDTTTTPTTTTPPTDTTTTPTDTTTTDGNGSGGVTAP